MEVSGRHAFRVARVSADADDATLLHDGDARQRLTQSTQRVAVRVPARGRGDVAVRVSVLVE